MVDKNLLITVGNVYLDTNIYGVKTDGKNILEVGKDYFADRSETVLGGSAVNFAMQMKKFDRRVAFLGRVGDDEEGREIMRLLEEKGIISTLVSTAPGDTTSTALNMIFAHNGEFMGVHSGNASKNLTAKEINLENALFREVTAIYFGGTAKQEKVFNHFPILFEKIQAMGIQVIVDPNRFPVEELNIQREVLLESFKYVDCYLPNEDEIKQVTGVDNLDQALDMVIGKGAKIVIVKRGSLGCRVKTANQDIQVPGYKITPVTTVGAGDTFNAGFISRYLLGDPLEECARFANAVAAIKVGLNKNPSLSDAEDFIQSAQ